jgi:hypothetical protein
MDVVRRAGDPARSAFDAVFVSDGRYFLLAVPLVHIGRTKEIAVLRRAFHARFPFFDDQMRLVVAFVPDQKQFVRDPVGAHPFIALHPLYPSFNMLNVPPAASFSSLTASFCFSAFGTPSTKNI